MARILITVQAGSQEYDLDVPDRATPVQLAEALNLVVEAGNVQALVLATGALVAGNHPLRGALVDEGARLMLLTSALPDDVQSAPPVLLPPPARPSAPAARRLTDAY